MPACNAIASDITVDVCVVGAGIAGLTTAYLLTKAGKTVAVLDDGPLAGGMTEVTTAHLSSAIDDRFVNIERWHGEKGSRLAAESHAAAIDRIETISNELGIECDFKRLDGFLFLAANDDRKVLDDELAAAHRAGLIGAELIDCLPLNSFDAGPAIRFPHQARFHPLKYLAGLAQSIVKQGGQLFTNSHADQVEGGPQGKVKVGEYTVAANAIVVATNSPINDLVAIHTKQAPYMTYVVAARVPRGSVHDALYWDTQEFYHYVRLQPMKPAGSFQEGTAAGAFDLLIVGGEDHKSGQGDNKIDPHKNLEAWARERFPSIERIEFTWGGQCMETSDGLGFIGRNPLDKENVYVVTGDSGMGITHGTIAGILLTDLILGRPNPWERLYDPSRKTLRAAGTFVKENLNVAGQYTDWVTPGEVDSVEEIEFGKGAVLRRGLKKIAVCRDVQGRATELSAVCPHLGCIVHWNNSESTWDCPCHGSRFTSDGGVINGPANVDLPSAK
jgi:glycine/D-amino acid oxidase-like deaminating enzyme/nitrite reductase/ring-hydroxylating ferredoxin subunit